MVPSGIERRPGCRSTRAVSLAAVSTWAAERPLAQPRAQSAGHCFWKIRWCVTLALDLSCNVLPPPPAKTSGPVPCVVLTAVQMATTRGTWSQTAAAAVPRAALPAGSGACALPAAPAVCPPAAAPPPPAPPPTPAAASPAPQPPPCAAARQPPAVTPRHTDVFSGLQCGPGGASGAHLSLICRGARAAAQIFFATMGVA